MTPSSFTCVPDAWLGDILGYPARTCRVDRLPPDGPRLRQAEEEFRARIAGGPLFAQAKTDVAELDASSFLTRCGFSLADTTLGLERTGRIEAAPAAEGRVRPAEPADAQAVRALAARGFRFSRFHRDGRFQPGVADAIKAAWAGNFFTGKRGQLMTVAEADGRLAGFCQVLLPEGRHMVIDLVCVDQAFRGRGVGRAMIEAAGVLSGREHVRSGTQLVNFAALAFYRALGFRIVSAQHVFHYHG